MSKKGIAAIAIAAIATITSTSLVSFASQNTATNVKDTVKVASTNTASTSTQTAVPAPKLLDISDAQAIQMAKDAIKYYGDVDPDKIINEYSLVADVYRSQADFGGNRPFIHVMFYNSNAQKIPYIIDAGISAVTGKIDGVNVNTLDRGSFNNAPVDYSKVREATLNFLKTKGFGTNYESMALGGDMVSEGINGSVTQYADGTEVLLEFDNRNYSLTSFSLYNLKTDNAKPVDRKYYPITVK